MVPVYQRLRQKGRSLPEGLEYVDSWVEANFSRCFQLMRCDDLRLIQAWILEWRGSGVTFEIVPVVTSQEARALVEPCLEPPGTGPAEDRPRQVDNVTFCVHAWPPAAPRRDWEEIEADVPFALSEQRAGLRARAQRFPSHSRQGGGACDGAQVRPERLSRHAAEPGHVSLRPPGPELLRSRQELVVPAGGQGSAGQGGQRGDTGRNPRSESRRRSRC